VPPHPSYDFLAYFFFGFCHAALSPSKYLVLPNRCARFQLQVLGLFFALFDFLSLKTGPFHGILFWRWFLTSPPTTTDPKFVLVFVVCVLKQIVFPGNLLFIGCSLGSLPCFVTFWCLFFGDSREVRPRRDLLFSGCSFFMSYVLLPMHDVSCARPPRRRHLFLVVHGYRPQSAPTSGGPCQSPPHPQVPHFFQRSTTHFSDWGVPPGFGEWISPLFRF